MPPEASVDAASAMHAEAVALFVARARAANRMFTLADRDAGVVAELCRRLDGLPLAIELAAARASTLAPARMLAGLSTPEQLPPDGPRDRPARHRTIRAALDWSHDLLEPQERGLLASLGVFVGGWTDESAEDVCGGTPALLGTLVGRSLVTRRHTTDGPSRFGMLETVREYELAELAEHGDGEAVRRRHADHFLALAEAAEPALTRPGQERWIARLEDERGNFQAAFAWFLGNGRTTEALALAGALARFWVVRGHLREGQSLVEQALRADGGGNEPARGKALTAAAALALRRGDFRPMQAFAEEHLALAEALGDRSGVAHALTEAATALVNLGDEDRGVRLFEESASIFRELGDPDGLAVSLANLASVALFRGELERASALAEESLDRYREAGDRVGMLQPMYSLGLVALLHDRTSDAIAMLSSGLALAREQGFRVGVIYFLEGLAAATALDRPDGAASLLGAAAVMGERADLSFEPLQQRIHDRTVQALRDRFGEDGLARRMAAARSVDVDDVVAAALGDVVGPA